MNNNNLAISLNNMDIIMSLNDRNLINMSPQKS